MFDIGTLNMTTRRKEIAWEIAVADNEEKARKIFVFFNCCLQSCIAMLFRLSSLSCVSMGVLKILNSSFILVFS